MTSPYLLDSLMTTINVSSFVQLNPVGWERCHYFSSKNERTVSLKKKTYPMIWHFHVGIFTNINIICNLAGDINAQHSVNLEMFPFLF